MPTKKYSLHIYVAAYHVSWLRLNFGPFQDCILKVFSDQPYGMYTKGFMRPFRKLDYLEFFTKLKVKMSSIIRSLITIF